MILQLALRNLLRRRRNSLILLTLFTGVTALFYLGNSVLAESSRGLEKTYGDTFTGHLAIKPATTVDVSLFGAVTPSIGEYYTMPPLKDYAAIIPLLEGDGRIADTTGLVIGAAALDLADRRENVPFFGVDGEDYFDFFPLIKIDEGDRLTFEEGAMITTQRADRLEKETGRRPRIGDRIKLSLYGAAGFKIREVPLRGIFSYPGSNDLLESIVLVDLQTARSLNALNLALEEEQTIETENSLLLDASFGDLDALLEGDGFAAPDAADSLEATPAREDGAAPRTGGMHFILIKQTHPGRDISSFVEELLTANGLEGEIMEWRQAAGLSAQLVLLLQFFYNGGFLFVGLAGIIAMINILLVSVFERTGELGTLRALGARKEWVRRLLLTENLILAGLGGLAGVFLGYLALAGLSRLNLTVDNYLIRSLLGRDTLAFTPKLSWAAAGVGLSLVLGTLATLFPLAMALAIEPSTAQQEGNS